MKSWKEAQFFYDTSSSNKEDGNYTNKATQDDEITNENEMDVNISSEFSTDMVFESRQNLIDWVQSVGKHLGYVIVIKRSINSSSGKNPRVIFQCDRGGVYKSSKISTKNTGSKKIGCPFRLEGKHMRVADCWSLKVLCELHNHAPALHMEGHPYTRRLSGNEAVLVEDLLRKNVKPRAILTTLKEQNEDNVSTAKTIYNARQKFRMIEKNNKTQMQVVMSFLQNEGYIFESRSNSTSNELEDLFFAHPKSLEIWRAFPHVLLMDATYKTNRYKMPLLEIVGVTSTNMTFCVAFVFMHKEKESNYNWALNCLKSTMDGCTAPRVIVTDRELALIKACNNVFPEAKGLLCRWHIYRSILKKCKPSITSYKAWNSFYKSWTTLIDSETIERYLSYLAQLEATLFDFPGVLNYLHSVWLTPYKEMFVSVWTDKVLNFGNRTTNRVESQHAKLKRYLESSQSDLETSLSYIQQVIQSQVTAIKASLEQSKILIRHQFHDRHYRELCCFISIHALDIISQEFERSKATGFFSENCGCLLRTSHGLPCAHEQLIYFNEGHSIPLDSVDKFWRKLDLVACTSLEEDNLGCDLELQMFNTQFKEHSRAGKINILRKLRQIIAPSTTLVSEPKIQTTTRGRPSFKGKLFRNNCINPPTQVQEPSRRSCSSASKSIFQKDPHFVEQPRRSFNCINPPTQVQEPRRRSCSSASKFIPRKDPNFAEQPRHSFYSDIKYSSHPYIHQFPTIFYPYITQVQDVRDDGNCGFRAIAVCLGLQEDAWPMIRRNLIEELQMYESEYINMFGAERWFNVYNSLNFFESDRCAPLRHWMSMPDMGVLIASKYNVIFHVLSNRGSMTYLPLRSTPPPWYQHVSFAIGHVNDNHYVRVLLAEGYPMPTIMPQWTYFKYDCAAAWATPYMARINKYEEHLRSSHATHYVVLE